MLAIAEADAVHPRPLGICTNGDPKFAAHNSRSARRPRRASERSEAILNSAKVDTTFHAMSMLMEGNRDRSASSRGVCAAAQGQRGRGGMGDVFGGDGQGVCGPDPRRDVAHGGACAAGARLMSMGIRGCTKVVGLDREAGIPSRRTRRASSPLDGVPRLAKDVRRRSDVAR